MVTAAGIRARRMATASAGRVRRVVVIASVLSLGVLLGGVARQPGRSADANAFADARLGPGAAAQVIADEARRAATEAATAPATATASARAVPPKPTPTAAPSASEVPGTTRSRLDLARAVGLAAVRGPAVSVELDDAPAESRRGPYPRGVRSPGPDDLVVHQQDVQAVVNALWHGGAEAMSIMGVRVTARTAVRCVGNTLLLDGEVFSPPFRITAIGDTAAMRTSLRDNPQIIVYRQYVDAYRLGYRVSQSTDVTLPAAQP